MLTRGCLGWLMAGLFCNAPIAAAELQRLAYHHPGLTVDLGVGLWAWPLPMDYDGDGDHDLVVVCPDVPYNGAYFFENPSGNVAQPVFKPGVRIGPAVRNVQVSYTEGRPRVLSPAIEYTDFRQQAFTEPRSLGLRGDFHGGRIRANQWKYCDFDDDGALDLLVGIGDWADYGWDNAFDEQGRWTNGPLHGFVYLLRNEGSTAQPRYADPVQLRAGDAVIDVYGMPSPNLEDFDGDGDLDLICGEFLDQFTYFENQGTRAAPRFAPGRRLAHSGQPLRMDLQMITPTAIDWDQDGDLDLVVGDEDGRVALVEHTGRIDEGLPAFLPPVYFQQEAADVKFGALVTPVSVDWDRDGDEDLICGNTAGYVGFIENLDGGHPPRWAAPVKLQADGAVLRLQAGPQGSIQGPCEAKWGYTTLSVADWDHDQRLDLVVNSIWGRVVWYRNEGSAAEPGLSGPRPVEVDWPGAPPKPAWNWWQPQPHELVTQWRTTPVVVDWDRDGWNDLVMLDHEGYLAWYRRSGQAAEARLEPPRRVFRTDPPSRYDSAHSPRPDGDGRLQLNDGFAGRSGRRKLCLADWNGDGRLDLLVNSRNVNWLEQVSDDGEHVTFVDRGPLAEQRLAGHTTSPTVVDWDGDGRLELLVGGEDGYLYYLPAGP